MVSASLLSFISDLFSSIHKNAEPFGGINVIVVGDLAQLPPVHGNPVYQSPVWKFSVLFSFNSLDAKKEIWNSMSSWKKLELVILTNLPGVECKKNLMKIL